MPAQAQPSPAVKIFLGVDCPISQKYVMRLNELHARYPKVQMEGIISGKVSEEQVNDFVKEYAISFPVVREPGYEAAKRYKAKVTPEAVLVRSEGKVIYQGAIDNWFYELGRYRRETTEHYLADAIDAALRGENPKVKKTEAIGCFLQVPASGSHKHHH